MRAAHRGGSPLALLVVHCSWSEISLIPITPLCYDYPPCSPLLWSLVRALALAQVLARALVRALARVRLPVGERMMRGFALRQFLQTALGRGLWPWRHLMKSRCQKGLRLLLSLVAPVDRRVDRVGYQGALIGCVDRVC